MSRPTSARDKLGWRIPQDGSVSRKIYELMQEELRAEEIFQRLKGKVTRGTLGVLMWKIRHPEESNQITYKYSKMQKRKAG